MVPASKGVQVAFDGCLGLADLLGDGGQFGLVLLVEQFGLGAGGGPACSNRSVCWKVASSASMMACSTRGWCQGSGVFRDCPGLS
jgi:hypothetical protein